MVCRGGLFVSSRRRHTRFDCDWSSDVCSSDLSLPKKVEAATISRLKIMSNLDIAERRVPQDGRIKLRYNTDRKSTRLNSSHSQISYAVFCLKKKKKSLKTHTHTSSIHCCHRRS